MRYHCSWLSSGEKSAGWTEKCIYVEYIAIDKLSNKDLKIGQRLHMLGICIDGGADFPLVKSQEQQPARVTHAHWYTSAA